MVIRSVLLALLIAGPALGAPPPGANTDSDLARWVRSAKDKIGIPCCDFSDCRQTAVRVGGDGRLEVWIGREEYGPSAPDAWMLVTDFAMEAKADGPPPDGRAWACFYGGQVRCFFSAGAS